MTSSPHLPKALRAIAVGDDSTPSEVFFSRESFGRLIGVSSPTTGDWHSRGKLPTRHADGKGRCLVAWSDVAIVIANAISSNLYAGLLCASRRGPAPGRKLGPKASTAR